MDEISARKNKVQEAINNETDKNRKRVLKKIFESIQPNGEYAYTDEFKGYEELKEDKEFVKKCIELYPDLYKCISPKLQDERDVLLTVAGAPIYYNLMEQGDYGSYAHCPLWTIISINSVVGVMYSKKERNPIVTDDEKINDEEIILEALKAELRSFDYCVAMEKNRGQIIPYEGLSTLKDIINGREVEFSKCSDLMSLFYATDEMRNNNEFQNKVVQILNRWRESKKNKLKLEDKERELSSLEAENKEYDEELKAVAIKNKKELNIGEE